MVKHSLFSKKTFLLICAMLSVTASWGAGDIIYPVLEKSEDEIDLLIDNIQYPAAEEKIQKMITQAKRRRMDTSRLELQQERCNRVGQALRGTDRIVVIDSVVVDKKDFLKAYNISDDIGSISLSADGRTTEFMTQRGNMVFTVEEQDGRLQMFSAYVDNGNRTDKSMVEGLGVSGDLNYPFLLTDGSTLYFSARSADGFGNYDLYVTRYDYEEKRYYRAESLGFPYNSYANDYMMVIDEERQLGWFASDRYQPDGKVCIYTFVPNHSRHPYDFENENYEKVVTAARLRPIKATWTEQNKALREQAKRMNESVQKGGNDRLQYDFTLVVNDQKTYHYYKEFRSAEAKELCRKWQEKCRLLDQQNAKMDALREKYTKDKNGQRRSQILQLEKQLAELTQEVRQAEKQTRNAELRTN